MSDNNVTVMKIGFGHTTQQYPCNAARLQQYSVFVKETSSSEVYMSWMVGLSGSVGGRWS